MVERISSLDPGYSTGDLSIYPSAVDDKETLYEAKNNAETVLKHSLTYNGKLIIVDSTAAFPDKGLVRVGKELIYYDDKTSTVFRELIRGYAGSVRDVHSIGSKVGNAVEAEHHNAIKDAIINIEENVGTSINPSETSLNGILTAQERKWLSPKPKFRAFPREGAPPMAVRFQNFAGGETAKFLWDFGDGGSSSQANPTHTYVNEGEYTVRLTIFTSLLAEGIAQKRNYIKVNESLRPSFMYVLPEMGSTSTTFSFVDQTQGNIVSRTWIFDDGETADVNDPDVHAIDHTYTVAGEYNPTLIVVFADTTNSFVKLSDPIIVS